MGYSRINKGDEDGGSVKHPVYQKASCGFAIIFNKGKWQRMLHVSNSYSVKLVAFGCITEKPLWHQGLVMDNIHIDSILKSVF
jgi:hypothetical protein